MGAGEKSRERSGIQQWLSRANESIPSLKFLGVSFWIAWFGTAYSSAVWVQPSEATTGMVATMFQVSTASHMVMLLVFALFSRSLAQTLSKPSIVVGAGLIAAIGCVLVIAAGPVAGRSWLLFALGSAITGVGTAFLCVNAGTLFCSIRPSEAMRFLLFAELIAALLQFMVHGLPTGAALALFVAFPVLSALCFIAGLASNIPRGATEESRLAPRPQLGLVLVVVFALSVTANVSRGMRSESIGPAQLAIDGSLANALCVIAFVLIALAALTRRRPLNFSHWFYPTGVVIISSLLITYLFPNEGTLGFVTAAAAYQLFDMIMWYLFSYVVYQSKTSAIFVVAAGRAVISGGVTLGNLLGEACFQSVQNDTPVAPIIYFILFVVSIATLLVLSDRQIDRLLSPIPDEDLLSDAEGSAEGAGAADAGKPASTEAQVAVDANADTGEGAPGAHAHAPAPDNRTDAAPEATAPDTLPTPAAAPPTSSLDAWTHVVLRMGEEYGLTEREKEVFCLLARGRGSQSISDALTISLYTTRAHTRNIYTKLDVHSRQELIDRADAYVEHASTA